MSGHEAQRAPPAIGFRADGIGGMVDIIFAGKFVQFSVNSIFSDF